MVAAENAIYKELSVTKSVHILRTWCLPSLHIVLDNCLEGGRRMPVDFCGLLIEVSKLTMAPVGEIQCFWFRLWTFTTCSTGILDWIRISRLYGTHMKAVLDILTQVYISVRLLCVLTHRVNLVHARVRARREFGLSCVSPELDDYWPFWANNFDDHCWPVYCELIRRFSGGFWWICGHIGSSLAMCISARNWSCAPNGLLFSPRWLASVLLPDWIGALIVCDYL